VTARVRHVLPRIVVTAPGPATVRAVVLLLPGGKARSQGRFRANQLTNLRMIPFGRVVRDRVRGLPVAVWRLHYRVRGWNEPTLDPVLDARWAVGEIRRRHRGAHIYLVGHSMGGRTALRCAADQAVVGVCALAPWIEPGEPVQQLAGCTVVIAHGDRDRTCDPHLSRAYADAAAGVGADVRFQSMPGDGHGMVVRAGRWNDVVRRFVASLVDAPSQS